ncbi:hypothetical protein P4S64_15085 [Vibrio sp. M60_M31a]
MTLSRNSLWSLPQSWSTWSIKQAKRPRCSRGSLDRDGTTLESYQKIGIDINVGAVEDGVALRRLTDSGGDQIREARFYPLLSSDVFRAGE